ncbi:MAG: mechanosensitive ion channel family protein [Vicinamibacterales bacterium]
MLESILGPDVEVLTLVLALALAAALAYLVSEIVARGVRMVLVGINGGDVRQVDLSSPIVRRPIRITRLIAFVAAFAALAVPAVGLAGVELGERFSPAVFTNWLLGSGLRILIIGLLTYLLIRVIASAAARLEAELGSDVSGDALEMVRRARTLSRLVQNGLTTLVTAVAILMVLRELQVDIMPVLTGAGILGLAVGFGAQTLVKDLISGFFLILENQVRVGDVAVINGTGGLVEAIKLRTIVLRDLEGTVHVFPNGSITTLANKTKDYSYALLEIGVAYKEDTDAVVVVLKEVAATLQTDPEWGVNVLEPLEVLGVDAFADSAVTIKIRLKTVPLQQWAVARELRRRIKKAFDAKGIEIPFPHMSLYFGEASRPFAVSQSGSAGVAVADSGRPEATPHAEGASQPDDASRRAGPAGAPDR